MDKILVSIVLPVYNIKEEYLEKCVRSLMSQTESRIEIILVDDGSPNNAYEVCMRLAAEDSRVKAIHQENAGVSVARNTGLENAQGEYICFVDPDDWTAPSYIEELLKGFESEDTDFTICDCTVCYENSQRPNPFLSTDKNVLTGKDKNKLLYQLVGKKICDYYPPEVAAGVPWGKMFRRSFIDKHNLRFIPGMVRMQDNIFCLYAIDSADKIHYVPKSLYFYRKEEGSACYKFNPNIMKYFEKYFYETRIFLEKTNQEAAAFDALRMKTLTSFNSYLTQYFFHNDNGKSFSEKKKDLFKLLECEPYKEALCKVDYSLLTKQEKVFVFALKHRMARVLYFMIKARSKFKM